MTTKGRASIHIRTFAKDLLFLVPFFIIFFLPLRNSVPSYDPFWINFWAAMVALAMTGVAWMSLQMFKAVLADQRESKNARHESRE